MFDDKTAMYMIKAVCIYMYIHAPAFTSAQETKIDLLNVYSLICVHIYIYKYIYVYIYMYKYVNICIYIYMYAMSVCTFVLYCIVCYLFLWAVR